MTPPKTLTIVITLALFVASVAATSLSAYDVLETFAEGETNKFTIEEKDFGVTLTYLSDPEPIGTKFSIDGVITGLMYEGDSYTIPGECEPVTTQVALVFLSDGGEAKLSVDGEITPPMNEGDVIELSDGTEVVYLYATDPYRRAARFSLDGELTDDLYEGEFEDLTDGQIAFLYGDDSEEIQVGVGEEINTLAEGDTITLEDGRELTLVFLSEPEPMETKFSVGGLMTGPMYEGDAVDLTVPCASGMRPITLVYLSETGVAKLEFGGEITEELEEGDETYIGTTQIVYLYASDTDTQTAKFSVNGELTDDLSAGEGTTLSDGSSLDVISIMDGITKIGFIASDTIIDEPEADGAVPPDQEETTPPPEEAVPEETLPPADECNGCIQGDMCLPYGTRMADDGGDTYCHVTGSMHLQKDKEAPCQNNYECLSNQCVDGICDSIMGELAETRNVLQQIFDWFKGIFG